MMCYVKCHVKQQSFDDCEENSKSNENMSQSIKKRINSRQNLKHHRTSLSVQYHMFGLAQPSTIALLY
uniref:Uncharacterized protein n=1 Tax=Onchocerca volvulus TaxID=6282 RepID=A0A8R1U2U0_ONCVO